MLACLGHSWIGFRFQKSISPKSISRNQDVTQLDWFWPKTKEQKSVLEAAEKVERKYLNSRAPSRRI